MSDTKTDFPRSVGDHHSTMTGYTVEAMFDSDSPRTICKAIYDCTWRRVPFVESPIGIPTTKIFTVDLCKYGLYDYEAAQALRWWFHAQANFEGNEYCLKTRLIVHEVVSHTTVTATQAVCEEQHRREMQPMVR